MSSSKRRSARVAIIVSSAALLLISLGAVSAQADFHPLPAFNYAGSSIGPIAIDPKLDGSGAAHALWVAENAGGSPRFVKFNADGQSTIYTITPANGSPSGVLSLVTGLAVDDATHELYASDSLNQRVLRFDPTGFQFADAASPAPLAAGGCGLPVPACPPSSSADGGFNAPAGIEVGNSKVYVADGGNTRVQTFTPALIFGDKFTGADWASTSSAPIDTAIDSLTGHVFVALSSGDRVDEFDAAGALVKKFGTGDAANGTAVAVAVDPAAQLLYVAKSGKIDIYDELTGALLNTLPGLPAGVKDIAVDSVSRVLYISVAGATQNVIQYSYDAPPTCSDTSGAVEKNGTLALQLECGDSAGSPGKNVELISGPSNGTLSLDSATGAVSYVPTHGYLGQDEFKFRVTTANGVSAVHTASINVIAAVPIVHVSANITPSTGNVYIKVPGSQSFVLLTEEALVPLGTIVDASDGHCISTFANADSSLYAATFWGGVFQMGQSTGDSPNAVMKLRDDQVGNSGASSSSFTSYVLGGGLQIAKKKKKNKVWGDGHGNFTTTGNGGSASVRGTRWLVENDSDGTLFKVARGTVVVRDYFKHKSITLNIGDSYFAQKKPKKKH